MRRTVRVNGLDIQIEVIITAVNKDTGSVTVRCYNDDHPQGWVHQVDLPVQDGAIVPLDGDALYDYIFGVFPMGMFARAKAAKPDLSYLDNLVQPDIVTEVATERAPRGSEILPHDTGSRGNVIWDRGAISEDI
jgi:hypothetical protein